MNVLCAICESRMSGRRDKEFDLSPRFSYLITKYILLEHRKKNTTPNTIPFLLDMMAFIPYFRTFIPVPSVRFLVLFRRATVVLTRIILCTHKITKHFCSLKPVPSSHPLPSSVIAPKIAMRKTNPPPLPYYIDVLARGRLIQTN